VLILTLLYIIFSIATQTTLLDRYTPRSLSHRTIIFSSAHTLADVTPRRAVEPTIFVKDAAGKILKRGSDGVDDISAISSTDARLDIDDSNFGMETVYMVSSDPALLPVSMSTDNLTGKSDMYYGELMELHIGKHSKGKLVIHSQSHLLITTLCAFISLNLSLSLSTYHSCIFS